MTKQKTNLEMVIWGLKHIAKNHGFDVYTNWSEGGNIRIYGDNIPTLSDVRMLAEDCKLCADDVYEMYDYDMIVVGFTEEWWLNYAYKPYEQPIYEFWKRME